MNSFVRRGFSVVGTLESVVGLAVVAHHSYLLSRAPVPSLGYLYPVVLFGPYFCFLAYLTWWRFSERSVRHISGTLAVFLFLGTAAPLSRWTRDWVSHLTSGDQEQGRFWASAMFLLLAFGLYWGARNTTRYFISFLFGRPAGHVAPAG